MLQRILSTCILVYALLGPCATAAFAADAGPVELNRASEAELDGLKGIGPALSRRILEARDQGPFQDWNDFLGRVTGVGPRSAARLSAEGLTVNGQPFDAAQSKPARTPQRAAEEPSPR
ncbi:MAG: ComEA family DNA-binding protein [Pseudomonadota bacterium]